MRPTISILLGGLLLLWPALYNGWPLVFTDTGAFMFAALERWPQWDKPIAYAAFLHALSWRVTYWGAAFAQGLIVSWLVWVLSRGFAVERVHWALMLGLAALTAAPWFTSQLMPDFLAAVLVLGVVVMANSPPPQPSPARGEGVETPLLPPPLRGRVGVGGQLGQSERLLVFALIVLAASSHLSHLALLLGLLPCVPLVRLACQLRPWHRGLPTLGLATAATFALLIATNAAMWGQAVVSPYGAVFPLARLLAAGPAQQWLAAHCPDPTITLCAQQGRFDADSDRVLWMPDSPLWAAGDHTVMAPEAARIVAGTLAEFPGAVAAQAVRDAAAQAVMVTIGDSLTSQHLERNVLNNISRHLPHEAAAFRSSRQFTDRLDIVAPLNRIIIGTVLLAIPVLLFCAREKRLVAATLLVLLALAGNAVICGATSKPNPRYQARLAWLLPLVAGLSLALPRRERTAISPTPREGKS
jgi:hypothetical protein